MAQLSCDIARQFAIKLACNPGIVLWKFYPGEMETCIYTKICTQMFLAVSFTIGYIGGSQNASWRMVMQTSVCSYHEALTTHQLRGIHNLREFQGNCVLSENFKRSHSMSPASYMVVLKYKTYYYLQTGVGVEKGHEHRSTSTSTDPRLSRSPVQSSRLESPWFLFIYSFNSHCMNSLHAPASPWESLLESDPRDGNNVRSWQQAQAGRAKDHTLDQDQSCWSLHKTLNWCLKHPGPCASFHTSWNRGMHFPTTMPSLSPEVRRV